jgi:hypothetical protein
MSVLFRRIHGHATRRIHTASAALSLCCHDRRWTLGSDKAAAISGLPKYQLRSAAGRERRLANHAHRAPAYRRIPDNLRLHVGFGIRRRITVAGADIFTAKVKEAASVGVHFHDLGTCFPVTGKTVPRICTESHSTRPPQSALL